MDAFLSDNQFLKVLLNLLVTQRTSRAIYFIIDRAQRARAHMKYIHVTHTIIIVYIKRNDLYIYAIYKQ